MTNACRRIAHWVSVQTGSPWVIITAILIVLVWLASGPLFGYSDSWQLIINTGTTIVTFLMVFLIQNAQNRDAKALHLKVDELIRGVQGARTRLVNLEQCSDEELERLQAEFRHLRRRLSKGNSDAASPQGQDVDEASVARGAR